MTDEEEQDVEVLTEEQPGETPKVSQSTQLAVPVDLVPRILHLLPLMERPFFPAQVLPIVLDENPWLETIKAAADSEHKMIGLVLLRPEDTEQPKPEDFYSVGTLARIHQVGTSEGKVQVICEGVRRFRIFRWLSTDRPYLAQVVYPEDKTPLDSQEVRAYAMAIVSTIKELLQVNPLYSEELRQFFNRFSPNNPSPLTDFATALTTAKREELQAVLEQVSLVPRMNKALTLIKKELEVARLQTEIHEQVDQQMSEQQRRFFLKEQLKIIQQELGIAKDDKTADIERFRDRLGELTLSEQANERVEDELQKISVLELGSPEYAVTRNYLDVITSLPWGVHSEDKLDLDEARTVLDRDHDGLEDVKDRIIEFLAVGALKGEVGGSIILLVGPPGVGKTSVGRSIANALGRKFFRFSVGGMRDEAEIKGHRRTYIGAMPGKVIQALQEVAVSNPVIMLDEVDKIGASYQGDPGSALLEVLDPEQNRDFLDHYLDVRFDLSNVLFVCTANQLDTIPRPLLDRMETIRLAGYIAAEKVRIARNHLWPRLLRQSGISRGRLKLSDAALRQIIEGYAREAGVRGLEKQLGRIVRKAAVEIVRGVDRPIRVGVRNLETHLGKRWFRTEPIVTGVGTATGLAWTSMGGATLIVEVAIVHQGGRGVRLTGQLGNVMQESASIAYDYIAGNLRRLGAKESFYDNAYIHIHVPEGATPKDGPSAGVTMATALLSLARSKAPQALAMTGELTLTGQVLAVGGIREKVIAARRQRISTLIMPEASRGDYEELPEHVREGMNVHFARYFKDVVRLAFPKEAS